MVALSRTLPTSPVKIFLGKRHHRKGDRLARMDQADVRLIDRDPNLNRVQILGEQEEAGGVETGPPRSGRC